MNGSSLRRPAALVPIAMSLAALVLVLGHALIFGVTQEADEGTAAHVFQFLMAAQLPLIGYYALKWLPRRPRQALGVLALQAAAALAAVLAVHWLT